MSARRATSEGDPAAIVRARHRQDQAALVLAASASPGEPGGAWRPVSAILRRLRTGHNDDVPGIVAARSARRSPPTEYASPGRSVFSNRLLLLGIAFEIVFAGV
jgi:hypothetical protein